MSPSELANANVVTPLFLAIMLLGGVLILFERRDWVLPTFLVLTTFVSQVFHIYVFGLNFFTSRILFLFVLARVLARGEHRGLRWLPMDKALVVLSVWMIIAESLQRGMPGFVYGVANYSYDALGTYFVCRIFISKATDLRRLIACLAWSCCVLGAFMLAESLTRHNWLTALGAVVDDVQERAGRMRCQATFLHPVLAGTYGAVLLPLFAACWWQGPRVKKLAVAGCIATTVITLTAGSGGPVMTFAAAAIALCFWPLRGRMRLVRWGVLLTLIALHLVMKAPVWALIGRMQVTQGASAYHRFELLDSFIRHIGDWWFIGIEKTESWGYLTDDVANTYCIVAKHSGLLGLILFIRLLAAGFREVGLRRKDAGADRATEIMVWAFGASLFGHLVTFMGTSYFDQTHVLWALTLAMIASLGLLAEKQETLEKIKMAEASLTEEGITQELPAAAN